MKNLIFYLFIVIVALMAPRGFAQTSSNADFNPFPQMEQDVSNTDSDTAAPPEDQNDDQWPPANSGTQSNEGTQ